MRFYWTDSISCGCFWWKCVKNRTAMYLSKYLIRLNKWTPEETSTVTFLPEFTQALRVMIQFNRFHFESCYSSSKSFYQITYFHDILCTSHIRTSSIFPSSVLWNDKIANIKSNKKFFHRNTLFRILCDVFVYISMIMFIMINLSDLSGFFTLSFDKTL